MPVEKKSKIRYTTSMLTPTPNPLHDLHHEGSSFLGTWYLKLVTSAKQSPLTRQILGAAGGAVAALVVYQAVVFAAPFVHTLFANDAATEAKVVREETQEAKMDRVAALAAEKLEALRTSAPEMFGQE